VEGSYVIGEHALEGDIGTWAPNLSVFTSQPPWGEVIFSTKPSHDVLSYHMSKATELTVYRWNLLKSWAKINLSSF
jgi:hypothetical protein